MAKVIRLAAEWLHTLFSLYWNYGKEGREAMSWVKLKTDGVQAALKAPKAACTPTVSQNMTQRISSPCEVYLCKPVLSFSATRFAYFQVASRQCRLPASINAIIQHPTIGMPPRPPNKPSPPSASAQSSPLPRCSCCPRNIPTTDAAPK